MTYQVWYMRPDWFREGIMGETPSPDDLARTHVKLIDDLAAPSMAAVFTKMQGEVWSPNGEARELIEEKGLAHTSMSVGDVLINNDTGLMYCVARYGFTQFGKES